jgi:glycosyltransferase involved in cell wall biosynthesis
VLSTYVRRIVAALSLNLKDCETVVYSTSDFLPDVLPAFLFKRKYDHSKWIQVVHHVIPSKREGSRLTNFISFSAQRISFCFIKRYADMLITVSPTVKHNLAQMGFSEKRIRINANGIDLAYLKGLEPEKPIYDGIFIGRLHASKGIFDLIKIWKVVCQVKPAKLGIIGNGDLRTREALKLEIERQGLSGFVDVLGYLEPIAAYRTIKASKVFVFPSHEEGFGIAILEAMACGLPVIATDTGGIREILSSDYGRIIPPNAPAKMANAVLDFSKTDFSQRKIELRAMMEDKFSWEKNVERLVEIYEELI